MTAVVDSRVAGTGRECPVESLDFVLASGGRRIEATRAQDLHLPPVAEAGARAVARQAMRALDGSTDALVCGMVPFDPAQPPDLFLARDVRRHQLPPATERTPVPVAAPSDPSPSGGSSSGAVPQDAGHEDAGYRAAVAEVLRRIDRNQVRKVVLARSLELDVAGLDLDLVWRLLLDRTRHGYVYAVRTRQGRMLGASPELIAGVDDAGLHSRPLAGSLPRGTSAGDDAANARRLTGSAKDVAEHRFVVDDIARRLAPLVARLQVPARPQLVRTDAMMHLGTDLLATPRPGVGALEAALTIHPTPAVCGTPTDAALPLIRDLEAVPRGYYAGLVGWTDHRGHGEWALALRCAAIEAGRARLFAGAGVVAGSRPAGELAETAAKLRTMIAAFTAARRIGALTDTADSNVADRPGASR